MTVMDILMAVRDVFDLYRDGSITRAERDRRLQCFEFYIRALPRRDADYLSGYISERRHVQDED